MAKRLTDTTIWKKQRWFKKLSPLYKLAWKYITDTCDHAGVLKIDFSEFTDDLGVDEFDINDFIHSCNVDFDKKNGVKIKRERIKLLNDCTVWITGFIKFQYEGKDLKVNPSVPAIYSALTVLNSYGTLNEGLVKGYFTLSKPYMKGMLRTKDKDKDKDIDKDIDKDKDNKLSIVKGKEKKNEINNDWLKNSNFNRSPNIPKFEDVHRVFLQNGGTKEMAKTFFEKNEGVNWYLKGSPITDFSKLIPSYVDSWKRNENNNNKKENKGFIEVPDGIDYNNVKY